MIEISAEKDADKEKRWHGCEEASHCAIRNVIHELEVIAPFRVSRCKSTTFF